MRLLERTVTPAPDQAGCLRIATDIEAERAGTVQSFWFDVPAALGGQLSQTGNPWRVLMLPLAMSAGEDIALPFPVDPYLLENIQA